MSPRGIALEVVRRVFEEGAYADRAFRAGAEQLDARDRAFAMQLAYGTVQRVRTLDGAIEALGRRPVRKLDPPVRAALRTGAYQLAYMDGVPAHAAVDETVELVRDAGLAIEATYGSHDLEALGAASDRCIVVARRPVPDG